MRAVGEIPSSNNLRLQNLVESQLEITKTESCLIALSSKFALQKSPPCFSPRTPHILAPRVLARRLFPRGSRPIEWGSEVESFPVDMSGSAGTIALVLAVKRHGVGWCVGRGYVRCRSVKISAAASVKRSLHVIRVVS
ncbi:hypothetical protein F2Q68_00039505 [Brassica cretica]|uniref:Uncharacterized protein n=1 Tax=Brassica cretica TaxID=69181 RepID=A0A8S9MFF7_BRACR|nr:hypothetical protein F2Q68_00039505 [Brassica cretica]